jgi:hypothetical protein
MTYAFRRNARVERSRNKRVLHPLSPPLIRGDAKGRGVGAEQISDNRVNPKLRVEAKAYLTSCACATQGNSA